MWRYACALALLCAALARSDTFKRAETVATAPFVLGSRYGRSSPRMIAPRNDRFFMGSRYGKRSEPPQISRTLLTVRDLTWRDVAHLCELQVFAPLCTLRRLPPPKSSYNRIDEEAAEGMVYTD